MKRKKIKKQQIKYSNNDFAIRLNLGQFIRGDIVVNGSEFRRRGSFISR